MSAGTPYAGDDFYCDVALPHPEALDVVEETGTVLAFHHTRPFWPVHVVVVPKRHLGSLTTVTEDDESDVRDLLAVVQPKPDARFVVLHSYDGYTTNLPLEDFAAEDAMLARSWQGRPLPVEHGGPVRLVVPHLYFWKSAKWRHRIEFIAEDRSGYWEERGYHDRGDPWTEQRYSD